MRRKNKEWLVVGWSAKDALFNLETEIKRHTSTKKSWSFLIKPEIKKYRNKWRAYARIKYSD